MRSEPVTWKQKTSLEKTFDSDPNALSDIGHRQNLTFQNPELLTAKKRQITNHLRIKCHIAKT